MLAMLAEMIRHAWRRRSLNHLRRRSLCLSAALQPRAEVRPPSLRAPPHSIGGRHRAQNHHAHRASTQTSARAPGPCSLVLVPPMAPWYHITVTPWYHGAMIQWHHATMLPRCDHGTMAPWYHGAMVPLCQGTLAPWNHIVPWCTLRPWYQGAVLPSYTTVPWRHGTRQTQSTPASSTPARACKKAVNTA